MLLSTRKLFYLEPVELSVRLNNPFALLLRIYIKRLCYIASAASKKHLILTFQHINYISNRTPVKYLFG